MVNVSAFNAFNSKHELKHPFEMRVRVDQNIFESKEKDRDFLLLSSLYPVLIELVKEISKVIDVSLPELREFFSNVIR